MRTELKGEFQKSNAAFRVSPTSIKMIRLFFSLNSKVMVIWVRRKPCGVYILIFLMGYPSLTCYQGWGFKKFSPGSGSGSAEKNSGSGSIEKVMDPAGQKSTDPTGSSSLLVIQQHLQTHLVWVVSVEVGEYGLDEGVPLQPHHQCAQALIHDSNNVGHLHTEQ